MQFYKTILVLASSASAISLPFTSGPSPHISTCPGHPATTEEQKAIFEQFSYQFFIVKNLTRAYSYVSEDFVQHNVLIKNGRQATIDFLAPIWSAGNSTILHSSFSDNFGWVHHTFNQPGQSPTSVFDLYRFEGSCIVEHWDVLQALAEDPVSDNPLW